jgi:hypothetical protein
VRQPFIVGPPDAQPGPALSRLVRSKGLQLRLELLMLFDAQCRHEPGAAVRNVRRIAPHADERYTSWRELVLAANTATVGTGRGPGNLRARQITEALQALQAHHLVEIPMMKGGTRRRYDDLRLLAESSTAEASPRYIVPEMGVAIPRQFFTNLWVFALTDTELATYLTLAFLRQRFPMRHAEPNWFERNSSAMPRFAHPWTGFRADPVSDLDQTIGTEPALTSPRRPGCMRGKGAHSCLDGWLPC